MSAAEFDMESLVDGIVAIYKANLNAKLLAISAEKNDGMTLKPVVDEAYFIQELNGKTANYNPYMLISIEDIQSIGTGPHTASTYVINAVIVVYDPGEDIAIGRRMYRYSRALKQVLEKNWSDSRIAKTVISSLVPIEFKMQNSAKLFRAVGIEIRATIG